MGMGKGGLLCDTRKRGQNMSKIITCEQVSNGHPDKICDQIADAIVTDILQHDKHARVAIECLLKKSQLFIAGEVTTDYRPNYNQIVHDVFNRIGAEKLGWNLTELLRIGILVDKQSPDIALGVDKGGAGDQGIMYGYAANETAEQMPIPYMVATKFLQLLKNHPSKMFRADAKAQVSYRSYPFARYHKTRIEKADWKQQHFQSAYLFVRQISFQLMPGLPQLKGRCTLPPFHKAHHLPTLPMRV